MKIKQYDRVLLKDGHKASIVEVFSDTEFLADIDRNGDTDTEPIKIEDISKVIKAPLKKGAFIMRIFTERR